jgi:hypothetical protein
VPTRFPERCQRVETGGSRERTEVLAAKEGYMGRGLFGSILSIVYFVVGVIVASSHSFFVHLTTLRPIASAVLAVVLWPLVLIGVNLHLK